MASGPSSEAMVDGVQIFAQYDMLVVQQRKKGCLWEMFCCETKSEFRIGPKMDVKENTHMFAVENSSLITRVCCGPGRSLEMDIFQGQDATGKKVVNYKRPLRCVRGFCCCVQEINTFQGTTQIGKTTIPCFLCAPNLEVMNAQGVKEFDVKGNCFSCGRPAFSIRSVGGSGEDGKIQKEWGGMAKECCTDADTFSVTFPKQATPQQKANLIGATFLLDYNFFENAKNAV